MISQSKSRRAYLAYLPITVGLVLLVCLRFVHLQADFPLDLGDYGMTYTDEGWWSRNAVAWVTEGSWYIDDGYNPVTNLPILTVIQVIWFKLFGVSLASARAIGVVCSVLISGLVYLLARRELAARLAWIAPVIVLTNYPTFAYSRLALLEMPMIVLILLSLWLVTGPKQQTLGTVITSGVCLTLAILTKTTALFALPVIFLSIYSRPQLGQSGSLKHKTRTALVWLLAVGVSFGICYFFLNQVSDPQSQAYFSHHNVTRKVPKSIFDFLKGPRRVVEDSFMLFPFLLPGLLGAIALLCKARKYKSSPLLRIAILWTFATLGAFSLSSFVAPRYFLVLIVPIALVAPLLIQESRLAFIQPVSQQMPRLSTLLAFVFLLATGLSLFRIGHALKSPQYTLLQTASAIEESIEKSIEADASRSNIVMGSVSDTLALAANGNIKPVNDNMGFRSIEERLEIFDPAYYLSVGPIGTLHRDYVKIEEVVKANYQLTLLETFDLYQNRDFDQPIFFYRLDA